MVQSAVNRVTGLNTWPLGGGRMDARGVMVRMARLQPAISVRGGWGGPPVHDQDSRWIGPERQRHWQYQVVIARNPGWQGYCWLPDLLSISFAGHIFGVF